MRVAAVLLLAALWASPARAQPAPSTTLAAPDGPLMRRATLVVSDMDRALRFYGGVLGFKLFSDEPSSAQSYSYPVFRIPRRATIRFATLSDRREDRTLALTEVRGVRLPRRAALQPFALVVEVRAVPPVIAQAKALGLKVVDPVQLTGRQGPIGLEAGITDWDGNLTVIYDRSLSSG